MRNLVALLLLTSSISADDQRQNPPDDVAVEKAKKTIQEIFGQDIEKAKTATAKKDLAVRSLAAGNDAKETAPNRWVLYVQARELAVAVGDAQLTIQTIDSFDQAFQINRSEIAADALQRLAKANRSTAAKAFIDLLLTEGEIAVNTDDYRSAIKLLTLGLQFAKSGKEVETIRRFEARINNASDLAKEFADVKGDDGRLGKFQCLRKGNWKKGLPFLTKVQDEELAAVAKKDLSNPIEAKVQVEVGDAWFELGEKAKGEERLAMKRRAFYRYGTGLDGTSGLVKAKTESRMAKIFSDVDDADAREGRFSLLAGRWKVSWKSRWITELTISTLGRVDQDRVIAPNGQFYPTSQGWAFLTRKHGNITAKKGECLGIAKYPESIIDVYRFSAGVIVIDRYNPATNFPKKVHDSGKLTPIR